MWLVDALSSTGMGSIVGLIGGFASKFVELKSKKLDYAIKKEMRAMDIRESELEFNHELHMADKEMERAQVEGEIRVEQDNIKAFAVSQTAGNKADGWLRVVRPLITAYMLIGATYLFFAVWTNLDGLEAFTEVQLTTLLNEMVSAVIFLTVMCIGWWFGSRGGNIYKDIKK